MKTKNWILLGAAAVFAAALATLLAGRQHAASGRPPKGAPQTPLHNPGDQSEFPTSPGEIS